MHFRFAQQFNRQGFVGVVGDLFFEVHDLLDLEEEPAVNPMSGFGDGADGYAGHQGVFDAEQPIPFRGLDVFQQFFGMHHALAVVAESDGIVFQTLTGFLDRFGEAAPDCHHFAHAFHLQAQRIVGSFEFIEVPTGDLDDHVVECRFEISRRGFGDLIFQFIQLIANGEFGRDLGNGISGGFARQGGGAADARIDLDGNDLFVIWV